MPQLKTKTLSSFSRSTPSLQRQQLRKKPHLGSEKFFAHVSEGFRPLSRNMHRGCGDVCTIFAEGLIVNAENQIIQMDGGAAVYGYDGEGRRMKKTVGSETTYFFYGVGGLLCEFTTTNTGATAASSTDRATYRTSDKLGSAVLIINASGTVIENNRTLPYGEAWLAENTPSTNDKKFTTYDRDKESALDYAMNRYYAAANGRFVSPDLYARSAVLYEPTSWNRYLYVKDDPINFVDPSGLCWIQGRWYADGGPACPDVTSITVTVRPDGSVTVTTRLLGGGGGGDSELFILDNGGVENRPEEGGGGGGFTPPPEEPGLISQTPNIVGAVMGGRLASGVLGKLARLLGIGGTGGTITLATMSAADLINRLNHVFGNPGHNFNRLLQAFGGNQTQAFNAIQQAALTAANAQGLANGVYNSSNPIVVRVAGQVVHVTGAVINGALHVSNAYIP